MPIKQLTEEQTRTWSREQKDRWWLTEVFRGDMPQLTLRSAATGFLLGAVLSAVNLYVGAKTGITLGVGLTSVILAYGMFKAFSAAGARDFTILENNAMQSIATSAGYMTAPIVSSIVAYMWKANVLVPWHQILFWNVITAIMGVLVAFPMKRRFINDEQQPFPEGRACGVVLDALYEGKGRAGMIQVRAMLIAGFVTAAVQVAAGEAYMKLLWVHALGRSGFFYLNEKIDAWYYRLAGKHHWPVPSIAGIDFRDLALRPTLDLAMLGTGGLMGVRTATSMMVGMVVNFVILAPWMIHRGEIAGKPDAAGLMHYTRTDIVNQWAIWWGVGIMVVGSLVALFAKPKVLIEPFKGLFIKRQKGEDVLAGIELPLAVSYVGIPICAVIMAWMGYRWYGVPWFYSLACLPLVFALSLICTNAMALTSWTPTGALAKITQFSFGMLDKAQAARTGAPSNPGVNLMTAGITSSVASNAANLLSDIKPGYMLGGKPRQQAIGHVIGIIAGGLASTPLFYVMFVDSRKIEAGKTVYQAMESDKFAFPAATQWKGVADIIEHGFAGLSSSIIWSLVIAAAVAVVFEIARIGTRGKFPLSPVSIGLGVVLPPDATLAMWLGSLFFHFMHKHYEKRAGSTGHSIWVLSMEPICAGMIAGAALTGIGDKLIDVFVLPGK